MKQLMNVNTRLVMQMIRTQERRGVGRGGEGEGEVGESPLGSCEGAEIMNA